MKSTSYAIKASHNSVGKSVVSFGSPASQRSRSVPVISEKKLSLYKSIAQNPHFTIEGARKAFLNK